MAEKITIGAIITYPDFKAVIGITKIIPPIMPFARATTAIEEDKDYPEDPSAMIGFSAIL